MEASELRIGNWILNGNDIQVEVRYHEIRYAALHPGTQNNYSPIVLSPEILEKAGFSKGEKWYIHQVFYKGQFEVCYNRNEVVYGEKTEHGFDKKSKDIKHLHQLQNLYFALTGEELNINL